MSHKIAYNPKT